MASERRRSGMWYARWVDADGVKHERKAGTDKRSAEQLAAALETEATKVRAGVIDPRAVRYRDHEARPLVEHLADFKESLRSKGSGEPHVEKTARRIVRVLNLAGVNRISDLGLSRVQRSLLSLRHEGLAVESINHHVRAVKGFARWLWKDGRTRDHHLVALATTSPEADRRRRRVLTTDEARRLVEAAGTGRTLQGLTGPDRAMLYRVALGTGFRAAELSSLTPASFRLDQEPPTVVCEAGYTKNGRGAEQPIPDALAAVLRPWVASKPAERPVFGKSLRTWDLIRADLAAAGLEYETASGVADFHSLRAAYISAVVSSGASVKTAQTLARHSTPSLTIGVYARASLRDIAGAVDALPDLSSPPAGTEAEKATGTTGRVLAHRARRTNVVGAPPWTEESGPKPRRINEVLAHPLPTAGDVSGRFPSEAVATAGRSPLASGRSQTLEFTGSDAPRRLLSGTGSHMSRRDGMADVGDLKSPGGEPPCGFESHRR